MVDQVNEDEKIEAAFRAGWRAGMYYERNPARDTQLQHDQDAALKRYLESTPTPKIVQRGGITGC